MEETDVIFAVAGEIMTPYVIMLNTDANFRDVIKTLQENHISAVFISDKSYKDYYIISQTDIINFLDKGGMHQKDLPTVSATEMMKGPITMMDIETPIDTIVRSMTKKKYKRILISKNGKATGVISTRDIMKWNNTYFRPSKPQILVFMDNLTSNLIAKHIFEENIDDEIGRGLIEIYGAALKTISLITDEIINKSGNLYSLMKEKRSILFEPYQNITGILICDYNSIELRRKLQDVTKKFYEMNAEAFKNAKKKNRGIDKVYNVSSFIKIFKTKKNTE